MADFIPAYNIVKKWESGYQAHPDDDGNYNSLGQLVGTNWGISAPVFESWIGYPPSKARMEQMTKDDARKIYKSKFWDDVKGDQINSQPLANILFDGRVNHGRLAVKFLQRLLGVAQDGIFGPITLKATNNANPAKLYNDFKNYREDFYKRLAKRKPSMKIFLNGWLNRIRSFKDFPPQVAAGGAGAIVLAFGLYYLFTNK